jgi:hypothetical protein
MWFVHANLPTGRLISVRPHCRSPVGRMAKIPLLTLTLTTITSMQLQNKQASRPPHVHTTMQPPSKTTVCNMYSSQCQFVKLFFCSFFVDKKWLSHLLAVALSECTTSAPPPVSKPTLPSFSGMQKFTPGYQRRCRPSTMSNIGGTVVFPLSRTPPLWCSYHPFELLWRCWNQSCGSGSGTGSVRNRNFWPDSDPDSNPDSNPDQKLDPKQDPK